MKGRPVQEKLEDSSVIVVSVQPRPSGLHAPIRLASATSV